MTGKEAREIVAGGLRFGDPLHIEAVVTLERIGPRCENGPDVLCTACEDSDKPVRLRKIGCFLCDECAAAIEAI